MPIKNVILIAIFFNDMVNNLQVFPFISKAYFIRDPYCEYSVCMCRHFELILVLLVVLLLKAVLAEQFYRHLFIWLKKQQTYSKPVIETVFGVVL